MEGRRPIVKRRRRRYRCKRCGKPATYVRRDGTEAADKDHDLCRTCFKAAREKAEGRAKRLLLDNPIDDGGQP